MTPVRPSEVTVWQRCPRLWQYQFVEGWRPPSSTWTPQQLMGTAIHAGVASWWKRSLPGSSLTREGAAHEEVRAVFRRDWPMDAPMEFSYDAHEAKAGRVLDAVLQWCEREMAEAVPVMVEQALGTDGHTTPDLVTREPVGLVVTDWKYSHEVAPDRVKYRLEGPERVHQFWHYVWAVGEHLKEPVALFRKVVIIGGPRIMVKDATFRPTPEGLAQWLEGAEAMWEQMNEERVDPETFPTWQNPNGCKPYGDKWPCAYWDACWTCHGDRTKMAQFYTKEPR